jgi:hypothetical protein
MLRLDLDEIEGNTHQINPQLFGINCWRPVSFHFKDYGPHDGSALSVWIKNILLKNEITGVQKIYLQSFPRLFGYAFNPISVWYCYGENQELLAVLAEVNNTFGEHHFYLLKSDDGHGINSSTPLQSQKLMHVSPFCEVKGRYHFSFKESHRKSLVKIDYFDEVGILINTAVGGTRLPLTSRNLFSALLRFPLLTLGVFARIHWQAFLLWKKRVPHFAHVRKSDATHSPQLSIQEEQSK